MSSHGALGSFLLKKAAAKSIRQRHHTGPQYYKRKFFYFPRRFHRLHRRISGLSRAPPHEIPEHRQHSHLGGDVCETPEEDFSFSNRQDRVMYAWRKQGKLQVFHVGGKAEIFVCYRCGYPVKSRLQVIKDDNWDWRMCYHCYRSVRRHGMESDT